MAERGWRIDPAVAVALARGLGWSPEDGVAALTRRMPERIPTGSTAKLAAIAAGEIPPGADPDALAEQLLRFLGPPAPQGPDGSAPPAPAPAPQGPAPAPAPARAASPSWSCWVMATVMAALAETVGGWPARVVGLRRIDDRSPVVDFHSVVAVDSAEQTWVCDPYFATAVAVPGQRSLGTARDRPGTSSPPSGSQRSTGTTTGDATSTGRPGDGRARQRSPSSATVGGPGPSAWLHGRAACAIG